ncbi:hypothetical protein LTR66_013919, partial [Elasticomyces elasticus]
MAGAQVEERELLPEVVTDSLGFKTLSGEKRARVCEQWPTTSFPPPYSSLLSIASARGLYAAGGPSAVSIGRTQDVRDTLYKKEGEDVRECAPLVTIRCKRPAHVAFASDESCLVVAEEESTQLEAYSTAALASRQVQKAVTINTNAPLRAVAPNPSPAEARYFAVINTNGQLLIADLAAGELVQQSGTPILLNSASCVTWSNKGKQVMVGRGDGTATQMKPDGSVVATMARPDSLPSGCHVEQIAWIDNDLFYLAYSPSDASADETESHHYIVTTNKPRSQFSFRKTGMDLAFAMVPRHPTHFFVQRLRSFKPAMDEMLIINNSVAPDTAVLARSSQPLSETDPQPADSFAMVDFLDEALRASLPAPADGNGDATAIGSALDLSDQAPITNPISSDPDIAETKGPIPQLAVLSHEGVLKVWSIIYNASVVAGETYQGITEVASMRETLQGAPEPQSKEEEMESSTTLPAETPTSTNGIGAPSATSSAFAQPSTTFGQAGGFGAGSAFQKSTFASTTSSWANTGFGNKTQSNTTSNGSAFGQPAFGGMSALGASSNAAKPAFGSSGFGGSVGQPSLGSTGLGQKPAAPAFGATGFGGNANANSPFTGATASAASPFSKAAQGATSGFGAFATQNGFGTSGKPQNSESPFAVKPTHENVFGEPFASGFGKAAPSSSNLFGQASGSSAFGKPEESSMFGTQNTGNKGTFGGDGSAFKIGSSFTRDTTSSKDENINDDKDDSGAEFGFGGMGGLFGKEAKKPAQPVSKEEDMDEAEEEQVPAPSSKPIQETPPSTMSQPKTTPAPHINSLFGPPTAQSTTPETQKKESTSWSFGNLPSTTPKDTPAPSKFMFGTKPIADETPAMVEKSEPNTAFEFPPPKTVQHAVSGKEDIETSAPLPPDPFSKTSFQAGDTSASSDASAVRDSQDEASADNPPPTNKKMTSSLTGIESDLPESVDDDDDLPSDFEGSGEDVTGDISPAEDEEEESDKSGSIEHVEKPIESPESSFAGQSPEDSPAGSLFNSIPRPTISKPPVPLFGEVPSKVPIFAPPQPKQQEEVRSPSPVRPVARATSRLSRSPERSFSAPAHGRNLLAQKKVEHAQSSMAIEAARQRELEMAKEQGRLEAAQQAKAEAERLELEPLEDDEEEVLRNELEKPVEPSENLDPFMPGEPGKLLVEGPNARTDRPAQIERLHQDINSMIVTLGINARSLSSFMIHQAGQDAQQDWAQVLSSETPNDALNEEWYLGDIVTLDAGVTHLDGTISKLEISDVVGKLEACYNLLSGAVTELKARITQLRRTTSARADSRNAANAPLSAEQASIQQDLRKSSALVTSTLSQVEDNLVVLRAKLAETAPVDNGTSKDSYGFTSKAQRKPTVEAVMNTVAKMTAMAEKKSADVDVLEAQLKKLGIESKSLVVVEPCTPSPKGYHVHPTTPGSGKSVYHTPGSKKGTPASSTEMI